VRIAILGGTFNPVHNGHLNVAREVKRRFVYDRIIFIPANIPAHKSIEADAGAAHRLRMLQLAVAEDEDFLVDDCELRRGGTSYTIDTIRELPQRYPLEGRPGLIIGDDLVEDFKTWRDVERLVAMVDLIIAHRRTPAEVDIEYPCRYVDNSLFPVSSSRVRDAVRMNSRMAGEGVESSEKWLPPSVAEYIACHELYR